MGCMHKNKRNVINTDIFLAPPKIIYASRTHSQLGQAVQELKRTAYRQ